MITCNRCQKREAFRSAQSRWSPELENQMYEVFYTQSAGYRLDEEARKGFANCCVSKIKKLFPDGIGNIQNEMTDSMKVVMMKMGVECGKEFEGHTNVWTADVVKQLKLRFYSYAEVKLFPEEAKAEYVDCVTYTVTAKYPNGMGYDSKTELQKFIDSARNDCALLVAKKYQKKYKKNPLKAK